MTENRQTTTALAVRCGLIEKSGESKERWSPGDPLPWRTCVCDGVTCCPDVTYQRLRQVQTEFEVRPDDTFVVTYPKSGTTWTLQIIKSLQNQGTPESVKSNLDELFPWLECESSGELTQLAQTPAPRVFKSHGTYSAVPKTKEGCAPCKYIHVMRHPKDICVSMYYHMTGFTIYDYKGPFSEFFDLFIHGLVESGSWFEYEKEWWKHRHDPNVLFFKYEDMHANTAECVKQIASFLNIETTSEIVEKTIENTRFKKMKQDHGANFSWLADERADGSKSFMRKGIVGDWKAHFSEEQNAIFNAAFHKHLDGTGLEHEWDIS